MGDGGAGAEKGCAPKVNSLSDSGAIGAIEAIEAIEAIGAIAQRGGRLTALRKGVVQTIALFFELQFC